MLYYFNIPASNKEEDTKAYRHVTFLKQSLLNHIHDYYS